jgi:transcriptional regulator with XRE-family HTH domain
VNTQAIRRRREKLGMTQAAAAKSAGWKSPVQWTDIETGKRANPTVSTIVAVAKVLECKVDQLLVKP